MQKACFERSNDRSWAALFIGADEPATTVSHDRVEQEVSEHPAVGTFDVVTLHEKSGTSFEGATTCVFRQLSPTHLRRTRGRRIRV